MVNEAIVTAITPLFGSTFNDCILVFVLGAIGGIVFALLMGDGIAIPGQKFSNGKVTLINLGIFTDIIVGGIAALVTFTINPQLTIYSFMTTGITSGIGGKAILTGYIKGKEVETLKTDKTRLAMGYRKEITRCGVSAGTTQAQLSAALDEIDKMYLQ